MQISINELTTKKYKKGDKVILNDDDRSTFLAKGCKGIIVGKDRDGFYKIKLTKVLTKTNPDFPNKDLSVYHEPNRSFLGFSDQDFIPDPDL